MKRYKRPDHKNAQSLIDAAISEMKFTLTIPITEDSASTIVRNIYECFRMLGDSLLIAKGIISKEHTEQIRELTSLTLETEIPLQVLDNLRKLRHNINYYGYKPGIAEAHEAIRIANKLFKPICKEVQKVVKK